MSPAKPAAAPNPAPSAPIFGEMDKLYFQRLSEVADQTFDHIVVGAGAYGTAFAHRILELDRTARVLLIDKGVFLIPDHIQNLPPTYIDLNINTGIRPWRLVGSPNFMPQIPYVGGRALYWNAWTPQPDETEMPDWPQAAVDGLKKHWYDAGAFMGRRYSLSIPGNRNEALTEVMRQRLFAGLGDIDAATPQGDPRALDSAMATGQAVAADDWAKFSPISVLVADLQAHPQRLSVAVGAEVTSLELDGDKVVRLQTTQGPLETRGANVILACNTLEAGFIGARSLPDNPLIGKNLCGHIRSWLAVRAPAASTPGLTDGLQVCGYYLPGRGRTGRLMHTHITVTHNPTPAASADTLYRVLPDASTASAVAAYQDPSKVVIMLHTMGEFLGAPSADSWNFAGSDPDGGNLIQVEMQPEDSDFWEEVDTATFQIGEVLAGGEPVEYQQNDGSWALTPPDSIRNSGLVHESGTLWMGEDSATSVTDLTGKVHGVANLYGLGSMLFPRVGSFNPTLTGVAQSFGLAALLSKT
jgi:choline dehydrogenase-like flavoprotein